VWLLGTDDYFEIADNALLDFGASDSFTAMIVARQWGTPTTQALLSKTDLTDSTMLGYAIFNNGTPQGANRFGDGTNRQLVSDGMSIVLADLKLRAMVRNTAADNHLSYIGTTAGATGTDTTTGTLSNSLPLRIGRLSGAQTSYAEMEVVAVLLFRRDLTAAEISQLAAYYGAA
jgi:hypothetical protein